MYKEYNYINGIGEPKKIIISTEKNENGNYSFTLWSNRTGDFCGSGEKTKEQIKKYLKHYNIKDTENLWG